MNLILLVLREILQLLQRAREVIQIIIILSIFQILLSSWLRVFSFSFQFPLVNIDPNLLQRVQKDTLKLTLFVNDNTVLASDLQSLFSRLFLLIIQMSYFVAVESFNHLHEFNNFFPSLCLAKFQP